MLAFKFSSVNNPGELEEMLEKFAETCIKTWLKIYLEKTKVKFNSFEIKNTDTYKKIASNSIGIKKVQSYVYYIQQQHEQN